MKKAVLFDFGNVLYGFDYGRFFRAVEPDSRMTALELRALVFGGSRSLSVQFETGNISVGEFISAFCEKGGVTLPARDVRERFIDIYSPNEPVLQFAEELAAEVPIGLVSNTNKLHFDQYVRRTPIFPRFSAVALSYVVGSMKPDSPIYESALEQLDLSPVDCVFVDDLEANVVAAKSLGFEAIHYRFGMDLRAMVARL